MLGASMSRPLLRLLLAALALPSAAATQSFTSPRGLGAREGDASHFALFNPAYARFQQIDDSQTGHAATLVNVAFRRDAERTAVFGGPRALDLTIRLGDADFAAVSGTFAANWFQPPTVAFVRRTVNTPDWSAAANARPMPFELVLPLDAPFPYGGARALAFELLMENVAAAGSPDVDAELGTNAGFLTEYGRATGFGCLAATQPLEMTHAIHLENWGAANPGFGMRIGARVDYVDPAQPVVLNLGFADQPLQIPGLCSTLWVLPTLNVPLGTANPQGSIPLRWTNLAHLAALEGVRFYTQALALAPAVPGLPIVVSERRDAVMPDAPRLPPRCAYLYAGSLAATSATLWRDRGVVVRFNP